MAKERNPFFGNELYSTGGTARERFANSVRFRSQQVVWMGEESLQYDYVSLFAFFSFLFAKIDEIS